MSRDFVQTMFAMGAAFVIAAAPVAASAGDLGLVGNGDIELKTRFAPFPTDHPNGYADGWHHSSGAAWSNGTTDPFVSATHSLYLPDDNAGGLADVDNEHRSFAKAIPGVGTEGRTLEVTWNWNWNITSAPGDMFSATFRISTAPVVGLDLVGVITDFVFRTDGEANSGGFQTFTTSIPLMAAHRSFDIIFVTGDEIAPASETGVMFVDDVRADVVVDPNYAADFDVDRDVDGGDLAVWRGAYGKDPGGDADADDDSDGADFLVWERQVGSAPVAPAAAVPEPSAVALAALAAAALFTRAVRARRRQRGGPAE